MIDGETVVPRFVQNNGLESFRGGEGSDDGKGVLFACSPHKQIEYS